MSFAASLNTEPLAWSVKSVVSTTSVSPSQLPRESPGHWGPSVYGIVEGDAAAEQLAGRLRDALGALGRVYHGPFRTEGARVWRDGATEGRPHTPVRRPGAAVRIIEAPRTRQSAAAKTCRVHAPSNALNILAVSHS